MIFPEVFVLWKGKVSAFGIDLQTHFTVGISNKIFPEAVL